MIEIKVPVLPESISEATVALWHKATGDIVRIDEVVVEIETDKVVLEVPSEVEGIMGKIIHKAGSVVMAQQVLAYVAEKDLIEPVKNDSKTISTTTTVKEVEKPAGPSVRRAIAENYLTQEQIIGSGKKGRILKEDVMSQAQIKNKVSNQQERTQERVPMTRLRKTVAEKLLKAGQQTATLTTFNELNMNAIIDIRNKYKEEFFKTHKVKLGFMSFFVKASVEALKKFPIIGAYIDMDDIVYHGYCDIAVAVSSKRGLVTPVIKNAHQMSMHDIEKTIANLSEKAQSAKLSLDEISGGTFTISNGGVFGSMLSTPILNNPQSAILGMHNIVDRAVVVDFKIVIRPIMYLALSYDHRIIDGRDAIMFLRFIKDSLEEPSRLLLDL